ncbi:LysR family transcriptional regulator [Oryzifoliimicrobium ureilyticus]|uniref:LysR family transcriptional regulator n=1 Tax=Oryzifoliimicrobium ureilyticus TaxID=3113724 RepID=UPI00307654A5
MQPNPTLDQLQVFKVVAEEGSFSGASRALNRAQSVISYTIANLEAQLELQLFERTGLRQPRLTEAGKTLLQDARRLLGDLDTIRARVAGLKQGLEAELSIALSVMVPSAAVIQVLHAFKVHFPSVAPVLNVGELGMVMNMVRDGTASIGIGTALDENDDRLEIERIGHSFMLPVAAQDHPLAMLNRPLALADVREETQLVVTDASGLTKGRDFNVLSYHTWRVGDIATKHELIRNGLGWGGLPAAVVRDDLRSGRLVHLDLKAYEQGEYPLYAIHRRAFPPGPAGRWMIDQFREILSRCPSKHEFNSRLEALREADLPQAAE